MRVLGIDYGRRRIGLAVSDSLGIAAHGIPTFEYEEPDEALDHIRRVAEERDVDRIVIGMPRNMDGTTGMQAREVKRFARRLRELTGKAVDPVDERLSTYEAEEILKQMDIKAKDWKDYIDQVAAKIILTRYLERNG